MDVLRGSSAPVAIAARSGIDAPGVDDQTVAVFPSTDAVDAEAPIEPCI